MTEIGFEWVMDIKARVSPPRDVGDSAFGFRRAIPIEGGTFEGPGVKGAVIPGGTDWQILREDGVTSLTARYGLKTDDGAAIIVTNTGLRHGPTETMKRLAAGEPVDPAEYYFRALPVFEAPIGPYDWLNKALFVTSGERYADGVVIHVYKVL